MANYNVAIGLGAEYLRLAVEPPIEDAELIDEIRGHCYSMQPTVEDGATVFFTNLPEGFSYHSILRNSLISLQAKNHQVKLFNRLGRISASNNPFECERLEGTDIESALVKVETIAQ